MVVSTFLLCRLVERWWLSGDLAGCCCFCMIGPFEGGGTWSNLMVFSLADVVTSSDWRRLGCCWCCWWFDDVAISLQQRVATMMTNKATRIIATHQYCVISAVTHIQKHLCVSTKGFTQAAAIGQQLHKKERAILLCLLFVLFFVMCGVYLKIRKGLLPQV